MKFVELAQEFLPPGVLSVLVDDLDGALCVDVRYHPTALTKHLHP